MNWVAKAVCKILDLQMFDPGGNKIYNLQIAYFKFQVAGVAGNFVNIDGI